MELPEISLPALTNLYNRYRSYILASVLTLGVVIGSIVYWMYQRQHYHKQAQQALSDILMEYDRAHASQELWNDVEIGAKTGYHQFSSSHLAPYFLVLQAEALLQQDKAQEALSVFDALFRALSKTSPYFYSYSIKYARVLMAQEDQQQQEEGLSRLKDLAHNEKNPQQDQARYYLAHYYKEQGQLSDANELFEKVAAQKDAYQYTQSPWVILAQQELKETRG